MNAAPQLQAMYAAFNARQIDAVLGALSEDVDWPNAWEGGRVTGREAVRGYWERQWAELDPRVEPVSIETRADGRVAVVVHQTVRTLTGEPLSDHEVLHVYELRDGLVARMDVEER